MKKLVTLITPCYNSEKVIGRYLDTILAQSYDRIQLILVDDGSTDKTAEVVKNYEALLKENLEDYIFLSKENGGPSSAMNLALKYAKGDYLAWADSDDVLIKTNIEKKVKFLDENPEYGLVTCEAKGIFVNTGIEFALKSNKPDENGKIFRKLIESEVGCYSGVFMIRTALLWDKYPKREIFYHKRLGQNWQLLLPIAYDNKCGYIDEILYEYHVRSDSHSHASNYKEKIEDLYLREMALSEILFFLPSDEKEKELFHQKGKCFDKRIRLAFYNRDEEEFCKNYSCMKNEGFHIEQQIEDMHTIINLPIKIILYGFGKVGKEFYKLYNDKIYCVVDNFCKEECAITFEEAKEKKWDSTYSWIIASGNYKQMLAEQVSEFFEDMQIICL